MYRRVYALAGALETKFSFQRETDPDPDRPFIRVDVCNRSFTPQTACNLIGSDLGWTSPLPLTMIKVESAVVVAAHSDDWQNNVIQTVCVCVHLKWKTTACMHEHLHGHVCSAKSPCVGDLCMRLCWRVFEKCGALMSSDGSGLAYSLP